MQDRRGIVLTQSGAESHWKLRFFMATQQNWPLHALHLMLSEFLGKVTIFIVCRYYSIPAWERGVKTIKSVSNFSLLLIYFWEFHTCLPTVSPSTPLYPLNTPLPMSFSENPLSLVSAAHMCMGGGHILEHVKPGAPASVKNDSPPQQLSTAGSSSGQCRPAGLLPHTGWDFSSFCVRKVGAGISPAGGSFQ